MEQTLSKSTIKKRVVSSVMVLGIRRIVIQLVLTVSNIILARILAPEIFGGFVIISFFTLTFGLLANFGLGPSLVQSPAEPTGRQLRAMFTAITGAALIFSGIIFLVSPLIVLIYGGRLTPADIFWLRLYTLFVFTDHLTVISKFMLQRNLEYAKLTVGEIVVLIAVQSLTILLAVRGWGVGSFVVGQLVGNIFSFLIFFRFWPWDLGLNFNFKSLKILLPFGLNFQATNIIGSLNSATVPLFIGSIAGPQAVGLVTWAGGVRQAGLAPFEIIQTMLFSSVARSKNQPQLLKTMLERMLRFSCMLSFPLLTILLSIAPEFTGIIYTSKWLPGLTALYLSLFQGFFLILNNMMVEILFGFGQAKIVRNITLFWAISQWVLTVPLVLLWNFNGVVLAGIIVQATFFIPWYYVAKQIKFDIKSNLLPYLVFSGFVFVFMLMVKKFFPVRFFWQLLLFGGFGGGAYLAVLFIFQWQILLSDLKKIWLIMTSLPVVKHAQ